MRYIDKTIETRSGVACAVWIATELKTTLSAQPRATVTICGWASTAAYTADKPPLDMRRVDIEDIETVQVDAGDGGQMGIYDLTGAAVIACILADEAFSGGVIKTF